MTLGSGSDRNGAVWHRGQEWGGSKGTGLRKLPTKKMICFFLSPLLSPQLLTLGAPRPSLLQRRCLPSSGRSRGKRRPSSSCGLSAQRAVSGLTPGGRRGGDRTARDAGSLAHQMSGAERRRGVWDRDLCGGTAPQQVRWARVEVESPGGQVTTRAEQSDGYSWTTAGGGDLGPPGDSLFKRPRLTFLRDSNPALPPSQVSPRGLVPLTARNELSGESCPCGSASGPQARREKAESQQLRVTESRLPPAPDAG